MDDRRRRFEAQALPHLDAAYNLARWLSRSPADAEDIVQDAILRAYRGFDGFRGGSAKAWLLAIVRNCALDAAVAAKRRAIVPLPDEEGGALTSQIQDPEAAALEASQGRKLNAMMDAMPAEFRNVLILREIEELSYREIAAVTDAPIGTVMSRLARARAILRERLIAQQHA
ncbi:MAG TPA: sigma-70 family RNA polymerase sigma factor [Rhizomicrobium sp.]